MDPEEKMAVKKQMSSSRILIQFLCIREMRSKARKEDIDNAKLEIEKEKTWTIVMKVLLRGFRGSSADNFEIAEDVEDVLQSEFETEVKVR